MTILIVEDEPKLAAIERDYLMASGYEVAILGDGGLVMPWLTSHRADLIVLDLMLPGVDGITLCRDIRRTSEVPIIMTTARVDEVDRLLGLALGADDYLCKPFSPRELVARVRAVLRRSQPAAIGSTELQVDPDTHQVRFDNQRIELTSVEFRLLQELMRRPGVIHTRDHLMQTIYSDRRIVSDRTIDSHIKKLRKKLQMLSQEREFVRSVYGAGYKYE